VLDCSLRELSSDSAGDVMDEKRMPISEHLRELRYRLIVCLVAVLVGMIAAYVFCPTVFYPIIRAPLDAIQGYEAKNPYVLKTPLLEALVKRYRDRPGASSDRNREGENQLHFRSLTEPFIMRLKISLVVGIILALPVLVYEIWAFVSAGLQEHERKYVRVYAPASFCLFLLGAALAYFVVLPIGVVFLLQQGDKFDLRAVLMFKEYAPFVMWLLLGFGLIFEMPLVVLFLSKIGLVEPRTLTRSRRYAILIMFIVAAFITPPDPFTQIAMAIPMMALYEFSILLSWLAVRKRRAAA